MGIISGVVGGAIQGIGSIFNAAAERRNSQKMADKSINAQKEAASLAYQRDVEMWNKSNSYNSPESQMERLTQAGLNPNLAYGSSSVAGNTSTQTPNYQHVSPNYGGVKAFQLPNMLAMLSQFQDIKMKSQQTDNLAEQKKVISSNAVMAKMREIAEGTLTKSQYGEVRVPVVRELKRTQLEAAREDLRKQQVENARKYKDFQNYEALKITENRAFNAILQSILKGIGGR